MARPTKLTKKLAEQLTDLIREGNYMETACAYVGVDSSTVRKWTKRGIRERERMEKTGDAVIPNEKIYFDFSKLLEKANAESEMNRIENIKRLSIEDWKASAWFLERRFPQRWAKKERYEKIH